MQFGSNGTGWFQDQISVSSEDCLKGREEITRLWGKMLKEFYPIARSIAAVEASDAGVEHCILQSIEGVEGVVSAIDDIKKYLAPFAAVAKQAVKDSTNG